MIHDVVFDDDEQQFYKALEEKSQVEILPSPDPAQWSCR